MLCEHCELVETESNEADLSKCFLQFAVTGKNFTFGHGQNNK